MLLNIHFCGCARFTAHHTIRQISWRRDSAAKREVKEEMGTGRRERRERNKVGGEETEQRKVTCTQ